MRIEARNKESRQRMKEEGKDKRKNMMRMEPRNNNSGQRRRRCRRR